MIRRLFEFIGALRGQLSVLDGWWVEGCIEGVTGWSIGGTNDGTNIGNSDGNSDGNSGAAPDAAVDDRTADAQALYNELEMVILPAYYRDTDRCMDVMGHAIALNGSFFNTERMVDQYVRKAYFR
ncbi:MAG: hypothetical protein Q8M01_10385 [Rubrivivax sp.]|nr:hypothetical protein [Rubrivivax sp.]